MSPPRHGRNPFHARAHLVRHRAQHHFRPPPLHPRPEKDRAPIVPAKPSADVGAKSLSPEWRPRHPRHPPPGRLSTVPATPAPPKPPSFPKAKEPFVPRTPPADLAAKLVLPRPRDYGASRSDALRIGHLLTPHHPAYWKGRDPAPPPPPPRPRVDHAGSLGTGRAWGAWPMGRHGPKGYVEARLGDARLMPRTQWINHGIVALDYHGARAGHARWIQFMSRTTTIRTHAGATYQPRLRVPLPQGHVPLLSSAPRRLEWSVDAWFGSPFYDARALAVRKQDESAMFDDPGRATTLASVATALLWMASEHPGESVRTVTFRSRFDSYLMDDARPRFHVQWRSTDAWDDGPSAWPLRHLGTDRALERAGPVERLPAELRRILHRFYPNHRHVR